MGSYSSDNDHHDLDDQIPILNFPKESLKGFNEEYMTGLSKKMREACEKYGCFVLKCHEEILGGTASSHEEMFMAAKSLFDFPEETK